MAWNPPPRGQPAAAADPFGAWPSTTTSSAPQWPSAAPQWPSSTSAPSQPQTSSWGGAPSGGGWPTSAPQQPQQQWPAASSSAWPSTSNWATSPQAAAAPQPPPPAQQQQWGGAWPATSPTASSAYPAVNTSTSSWQSSSNNNNGSAWPSSTTSAGGGGAGGWSQPPQQPWGAASSAPPVDPWAAAATSTSFNGSFQSTTYNDPYNASRNNNNSMMNTSYQSASFNNPFDVTVDDAGFFASSNKPTKPAAAASASFQQQQQQRDVPPPSATTQRLMRVASMLFERGALIKADKMLIQEMVLRGDKKAERALESAERDGRVEEIHRTLLVERNGGGGGGDNDEDEEDDRAEQAATSFKKRPSVARKNSDDDDEQTETLGDFKRSASMKIEAPHPMAGGYSGTIPQEMSVQKGQFVGPILMRISSKKMFRKWKTVFFALDLPRLVIYENRREWEMGSPPKFVLPLHECMWIAKPTLKKTYSLIDDGRRVYYSTLKENAPAAVAQAAMAGMERPTAFSPALDSRVVAKFGSYYPDEISSFAHAVYSCVLHHQREMKSQVGGKSSRASATRQASYS